MRQSGFTPKAFLEAAEDLSMFFDRRNLCIGLDILERFEAGTDITDVGATHVSALTNTKLGDYLFGALHRSVQQKGSEKVNDKAIAAFFGEDLEESSRQLCLDKLVAHFTRSTMLAEAAKPFQVFVHYGPVA